MFANTFFKLSTYALGLHIVEMITGVHLSQEIFAV